MARALDVVGDRWSLLIVRELLLRESRFTDLRNGLPGVATNILSERLRSLEQAGIVERVDPRPPVATALYKITDHGRGLAPVLRELARWSVPLMSAGQGEDESRGRWLLLAVRALFHGADLEGLAGLKIAVECEGETFSIEITPSGHLDTRLGELSGADVHVRGSADAVMSALTGMSSHDRPDIEGDDAPLRDLRSRMPELASARTPAELGHSSAS